MNSRTARSIPHNASSELNSSIDRTRLNHSREIKALPIAKAPNQLPQYYFGPNTITQPSTYRESSSRIKAAGASQLTARPSRDSVPNKNYSVGGYMNSSRSHSSVENEENSNLAIREISHGSVFNNSHLSARDGQSTHRPSRSIDGCAVTTESTARGGNTGRSNVSEIAEKYKALLKAYEKLVKMNLQVKEELEKEKEGNREQRIYVKQLKEILEESIAKAGLSAYFREGIEKIQGDKSLHQYFFDIVSLQKMLGQTKQENKEFIRKVDESKRELEEKEKRIDMLINEMKEAQEVNEKLRSESKQMYNALEMAKLEKKEDEREKELMLNAFKSLKENSVTRNEYININSHYNSLRKQYEQLENDYKELKKFTLQNSKDQIQELCKTEKAENKENLSTNRITFYDEMQGKKLPTQPLRPKVLNQETLIQEKMFGWNQASPIRPKMSDEAIASSVGWSQDQHRDSANIEDSQLKLPDESRQIRAFIETKQTVDIQFEALQNKVATVVEYLHAIRQEIFDIVNENGITVEHEENREGTQNIVAIQADFEATLGSLRLLREMMNDLSANYEEIKKELVREQKKSHRLQLEKMEKQKEDLHFEDYEKIKLKLEQIHRDAALRAKEREFLEKTIKEERELSRLAIMSLQKFIYNEEIGHTVKKFLNIHERRKKVQKKILIKCKENRKGEGNEHDDSANELQDELKKLAKLENDILKELSELERQEKRRYESLYLLEKQNLQLKNEVLNRQNCRLETQEDNLSQPMSTMKQSTLSKMLEDVRMPMTRINFDFECTGKLLSCETEAVASRDTIDH